MRRGSKSTTKEVVGYLVSGSCTFLVHHEAQSAYSLLRDYLPWGNGRTRTAGRPILEVLDTVEGADSTLTVVGRLKDFMHLGQSPTGDVLVIPRLKTPEQIRDGAWAEVRADLLVPSANQKDWAHLYRHLRHSIPPASCALLFGPRKLTQEAFAASVGIHPRTLARALKKHPAHPVGRQTIFQEALNESSR